MKRIYKTKINATHRAAQCRKAQRKKWDKDCIMKKVDYNCLLATNYIQATDDTKNTLFSSHTCTHVQYRPYFQPSHQCDEWWCEENNVYTSSTKICIFEQSRMRDDKSRSMKTTRLLRHALGSLFKWTDSSG